MQKRQKWTTAKQNPEVGDVVLVTMNYRDLSGHWVGLLRFTSRETDWSVRFQCAFEGESMLGQCTN